MRLIGATNYHDPGSLVVEGTILGLLGAAISLGHVVSDTVRRWRMWWVGSRSCPGSSSFSRSRIYPSMAAISLALGGGLGLVVSFLTIRRHLKV